MVNKKIKSYVKIKSLFIMLVLMTGVKVNELYINRT